jgi:uncharacterized membrane protein
MTIFLVLGLVLFLGLHSLRMLTPRWRAARIASLGEQRWKLIMSLLSLASFALLVWGYGAARGDQAELWVAPLGVRHLTGLPVLVGFIFLVAAYLPGTRIKARLGHPMLASTALWALGHLLSNARPADLLLFGGIALWAIADFFSARRRDRVSGAVYPAGSAMRDLLAVVIGTAAWAAFAFGAHLWLIGVRPFAV